MLEPLRVLHDGGIGDFVTWAVLGTVVLTGLLAVVSGAV
jgi:hypothetical protein